MTFDLPEYCSTLSTNHGARCCRNGEAKDVTHTHTHTHFCRCVRVWCRTVGEVGNILNAVLRIQNHAAKTLCPTGSNCLVSI